MDKRTNIGKMIDKNRVVYQCLVCNKKFIGDINTDISKCGCSHKNCIVIVENMLVINKGV